MPNKDGTGPSGMGRGTGKNGGKCFGKAQGRGLFYTVIIPAATGVVRDLMNPNGFIRGVTRALLGTFIRKRASIGTNRQEYPTKIVDAEVMEIASVDKGEKKK